MFRKTYLHFDNLGEVIDHPNIKLVLSPGNRRRLELLEKDAGVYIFKNVKKGIITIYGPDDNSNQVIRAINRLLSKLNCMNKQLYHSV